MVVAPRAQQLEGGEAPLVDHDRLTVDEAGSRRQALHRLDDAREAVGEVGAMAGVQPHVVANAPRQDAKAVVLDLVNPARQAALWLAWAGRVRWWNGDGRRDDAWISCGIAG